MKPAIWVDTPDHLQSILPRLNAGPRLAVDTESNGLHAYREQVCLIQISTPADDYLIDPLKLKAAGLAPLGDLFANPSIEKIFHAAEYDLICLKRDFGFQVQNLFDTMLAARILNYPAVGLNTLLTEKFGIRLNKRYQKANWGKRPLPPEMLDYARMDTHYLFDLRDLLEKELRASGWLPLAQEDFARACHVAPVSREVITWERILGRRHLSPEQTALLQALVAWRETQAAQRDVPTFKVLGNQKILALAEIQPRTRMDLRAAGLSEKQIQRMGDELLRVTQSARGQKPQKHSPFVREDPDYLDRLHALGDWRKKEGKRRGAPSDAILPRDLMQAIARQAPTSMEALQAIMRETPWRFAEFGAEILHILQRH